MATSDDVVPSHGDPDREPMQVPVDVRSLALAVLAVLATIAALRWAKDVVIPLLIGLLLTYALGPVVDRLVAWKLPRAAAAALVVSAILGGAAWTVYSLYDDAIALVESLPGTAVKIGAAIRPPRGKAEGPIDKVQKAAAELERAANEAVQPSTTPPREPGVTRVRVEKPRFDVREYLWAGTLGLVTLGSQAVAVTFITFFALASGDTFRRKLVRIAGPTFAKKRITVQMLDDITAQIKRYLLVNVATSVVVGLATWLAFLWIGLEHAGVWGVIAALINMIPYVGAIAVTVGAALVGFVQFGSLEKALVVSGASFVIQMLEGYLLLPWLTSKASRISPLVVFVSVLVFAWMWGVWGLLLGVPIVMVIKSVCDHIEDLQPIGELLGD
jgi:predicted PurR-regulated permease PerM